MLLTKIRNGGHIFNEKNTFGEKLMQFSHFSAIILEKLIECKIYSRSSKYLFITRKHIIKSHQLGLFLIYNCFPWLPWVVLMSFGDHFEKWLLHHFARVVKIPPSKILKLQV